MKATVIKNDHGSVRVRIRRGAIGDLYNLHTDLKSGDTVEVRRQINNPYLIRTDKPK